MEIRRIQRCDVAAAAGLFRSVFAEPPYLEAWNQDEAEAYLERLYELDVTGCFSAWEGACMIGCLFGHSYPWRGRTTYFLQELFVSRTERRRGVGTQLVNELVASFGGELGISLVANERSAAGRFYHKLGLSQHAYHKFYTGHLEFSGQVSGRLTISGVS